MFHKTDIREGMRCTQIFFNLFLYFSMTLIKLNLILVIQSSQIFFLLIFMKSLLKT